MKKIILAAGILCFANVFGQSSDEETERLMHHQVGAVLGHTHIPHSFHDNEKKWSIYPSFTVYYNYWINKKWAVGLHTDLVLEDYEVIEHLSNDEEEKIIERENPVAPAVMAIYKPGKHFSYQVGAGGEFAKDENFFLIRAEVEYGLEMKNDWEFTVSLGNDFRWEAYNTLNFGVGISKKF